MKRCDFIKMVAEKANFTQGDVRIILDTAGDVVTDVIKNEDSVKMFEGLTVSGVRVDTKEITNYFTNEVITVDEHILPKAKFTRNFKNKIK